MIQKDIRLAVLSPEVCHLQAGAGNEQIPVKQHNVL